MSKTIEVTDLAIRLTGDITHSNFPAFKERALALIAAADKPLVSDQDFAEAEQTIKSCKIAEDSIKSAKGDALGQTINIRKLFADMDEVSSALRKTRLSRTKEVKAEKELRKLAVIDYGVNQLTGSVNKISIELREISLVFKIDRSLFQKAIAGRQSIDIMKERVEDVLRDERSRLDELRMLVVMNLATIEETEKKFHGLFPDKNSLIDKSTVELAAIISGRVAGAKLDEQKKKEAARIAAEKKSNDEMVAAAKKEDEEKTAVNESPMVSAENEGVGANQVVGTERESEEAPPRADKDKGQKEKFLITVSMSCTAEDAKSIAQELNGMIGEYFQVTKIKLNRG